MDELEQKVYNGEQLTEEELSDLAWHEHIETIYGESGRWQQSVSLIFKIGENINSDNKVEYLLKYSVFNLPYFLLNEIVSLPQNMLFYFSMNWFF